MTKMLELRDAVRYTNGHELALEPPAHTLINVHGKGVTMTDNDHTSTPEFRQLSIDDFPAPIEWTPIPNIEGYFASPDGKIASPLMTAKVQ